MKVDKVPRMRRVTVTTLVCALIFGLLATWLGPKMIAYWYAPPVPAGAASAFNCTDAVQWAMNKLVVTQIIGTFIGVVVGLVFGILMRPKGAPPRVQPPPTTKVS
jgi:hypothetical protein